MGKPKRHQENSRNVLVVIAIADLIAFKILVYVHLGVRVLVRGQGLEVALPDNFVPHDGVKELEQRLGEGVGEHDEVDVV